MAPPKTSEYEQDHTKVEKEAGDDGAGNVPHSSPRTRRARSAEPGPNNKTFNGFKSREEYVFTLSPKQPEMIITRVSSNGSIGHDDAVIITSGKNAVLLGTEDMPNQVTPTSTTTGPAGPRTAAEKGQPYTSLGPNVHVGLMKDPFTDFLVKWINRRNIYSQADYEKIWKDIEGIWNELIVELHGNEDEIIKGMCEKDQETDKPITAGKRPLCKALLKTFLYMDGKGVRDGTVEEMVIEKELSFMRCIVGAAGMIKLFGDHCNFGEMKEYAHRAARGMVAGFGVQDNSQICAWMNFDELTIGSQFIGKTIAEWSERDRSKVADHVNLENQRSWCWGMPGWGKGGKEVKKQGGGEVPDWLQKDKVEKVRETIEDRNLPGKEDVNEVLKEIKENEKRGEDFLAKQSWDSLGTLFKRKMHEKQQDSTAQGGSPAIHSRSDQTIEENIPLQPQAPPVTPESPYTTEESEGGGEGGEGGEPTSDEKKETESKIELQEEVVPDPEEKKLPVPIPEAPQPAEPEDTDQTGKSGPPPVPAALAAPAELSNKMDHPNLTSYLPLAPAVLGISAMSYLLWKYFGMLRKTRERYRRAPKALGPTVEEQLLAHVYEGGPREYYIVKERKPRSTPKRSSKKRDGCRRAGRRSVLRRMIIDIHLEVLDECQKGDIHSRNEDFFEFLVQEFMGSEFIKEEDFVPKEHVPSSGSYCGFREG
ncbi:SICA antigen [Plasmodium coatneyi]|uniref:SICA antigen n=1 Tax=Plasmodium coatneyi TaxID=208452 RepID=A0A1B1DX41_9APIC|nr:SICA antigen [Plasmodium coatneyi]ANQ07324.1 SICA antigen [Plasmodium coatneyi]